jgi:anti-sigma-K factor RskA
VNQPQRPHSEYADALGAYVLGALDPGERGEIERHVQECKRCGQELVELQGAAEILPRSVPQLRPPAGLKDRIMGSVEAEAASRQPRVRDAGAVRAAERPRLGRLFGRPLTAAAMAAAVAVAVAGIVVLGGRRVSPPGARVLSARITDPSVAARARASVRVVGNHATLQVRALPHPPPRRVYQVWLQRPGGSPVAAGSTFIVRTGTVEVRRPLRRGQRVLVTIEPAPGSSRPTRPPLIVARPA